MRQIALVVSVVALVVSCKRTARFQVDLAAVKAKGQLRMEHVMERPAVDAAIDRVIDAIGADPEVRERGTALLTTLGADATIAKAVDQLMATAQSAPEVQTTVRELMTKHPELSADQIGERVGERVEANWSSHGIGEAWMAAWNRFLPKLHVGAVPAILDSAIGKRYEAYVEARSERWGERIVELNGGSSPAGMRAADLYLDHAWSEQRLESFVLTTLNTPRFSAECVAMVRRLLHIAVVRDALHEAAAKLAADDTVRDAATTAIVQLIVEHPSVEAVGGALDRLLQAPPTATAVNQLVARVLADPKVPQIVVDAFDHLRSDPQLVAAVDQLLDHW